MSRMTFRNAGGVPFLTLKGVFVIRARQQPDGDTVAFAAARRFDPGPVDCPVPVDPSGATSLNLRFQSIDASEKTQPMGAVARDSALAHLGLDPEAMGLSDTDFTAAGETITAPGWIATHGMDGHDRQLSYLFVGDPGFRHGKVIPASALQDSLDQSVNHALVSEGAAFPAFYENTDERHAAVFQEAAAAARRRRRGVWRSDRTAQGFVPTKAALGPDGALVYPKFFRRVQKWKQAQPDADAFLGWLRRQSDGRKLVQGAERNSIPLWRLFEKVSETEVAVPYDVTRLWFSE